MIFKLWQIYQYPTKLIDYVGKFVLNSYTQSKNIIWSAGDDIDTDDRNNVENTNLKWHACGETGTHLGADR